MGAPTTYKATFFFVADIHDSGYGITAFRFGTLMFCNRVGG